MKYLMKSMGVAVVLAVTACAPTPPLDDARAESAVVQRDIANMCAQKGHVRNLSEVASYISTRDAVIASRVGPERVAKTRAKFGTSRVTLDHCRTVELEAAKEANARRQEAADAESYNRSMDEIQRGNQALMQNRPRQTICTNAGGGMAMCNTY